MIRPGRQPRPDSCCVSSDVLTSTERAAERPIIRPEITRHKAEPDAPMRWGDVPAIRSILNSLRSKL